MACLNADELQRESPQFVAPATAARGLIRRLDAAERAVLLRSGRRWRREATSVGFVAGRGFRTVLHFIELPSPDFAVARVQALVDAGGHDIAEEDVRRRFDRGCGSSLRYTKMSSTSRAIGSFTSP